MPEHDTRLQQLILEWFSHGEKCKASEAIALTLLGAEPATIYWRNGLNCHPTSSDDFRRCYLLMQTLPDTSLITRLSVLELTVWPRLIRAWGTLCTLYEEERHQDEYPRLQAMLDELTQAEAA